MNEYICVDPTSFQTQVPASEINIVYIHIVSLKLYHRWHRSQVDSNWLLINSIRVFSKNILNILLLMIILADKVFCLLVVKMGCPIFSCSSLIAFSLDKWIRIGSLEDTQEDSNFLKWTESDLFSCLWLEKVQVTESLSIVKKMCSYSSQTQSFIIQNL